MEIKAPYLPYDAIRDKAKAFLSEYNHEQAMPVPIEEVGSLMSRELSFRGGSSMTESGKRPGKRPSRIARRVPMGVVSQ